MDTNRTMRSSAEFFTPSMLRGLEMVWESYNFARELGNDPWDFALEIDALCDIAGLTSSELRWLTCNGLIAHGVEVTDGQSSREFSMTSDVAFSAHSCFILTRQGVDIASQLFATDSARR